MPTTCIFKTDTTEYHLNAYECNTDTTGYQLQVYECNTDTTYYQLQVYECNNDTTDYQLQVYECKTDTTDYQLHTYECNKDTSDYQLHVHECKTDTTDCQLLIWIMSLLINLNISSTSNCDNRVMQTILTHIYSYCDSKFSKSITCKVCVQVSTSKHLGLGSF